MKKALIVLSLFALLLLLFVLLPSFMGRLIGTLIFVFMLSTIIIVFCRNFKSLRDKKWIVHTSTVLTVFLPLFGKMRAGELISNEALFYSAISLIITDLSILKLFYTSASKKVSEVKTVPPSGIKCIPKNVECVCPKCGVIHIVPGNVETVNCYGHCFSTKEYKK